MLKTAIWIETHELTNFLQRKIGALDQALHLFRLGFGGFLSANFTVGLELKLRPSGSQLELGNLADFPELGLFAMV